MAQSNHPFFRVIAEMVADGGILNEEDVRMLEELVGAIERPGRDVQRILWEHPNLQSKVGFFKHYIAKLAAEKERDLDELWFELYRQFKQEAGSRLTEKAIEAQIRENPAVAGGYAALAKLEYFSNQVSEFHATYVTRARLLEQVSNNTRLETKLLAEGDDT